MRIPPDTAGRLLLLSQAFFVLSLVFPAFYTSQSDVPFGFELLLTGWMGILTGVFAWLANPCLIFAWIAFSRRQPLFSLLFSVVACILMLSFFRTGKIIVTEAPTTSSVSNVGVGYALWLGSAMILICANVAYRREVSRVRSNHGP